MANQYSDDRKAIRRWLILALVKRVFGGTPDSVIRPIREVLRDSSSEFPLDKVIGKFKGTNKSIVTTADDVENMLCYQYGQGYTFSTLTLFYPSFDFRNRFHIDHIHPRSHFTKTQLRSREIPEADYDFYMENVDALPNLQLLEGIPNQEKSATDFNEWLDGTYPSKDKEARDDYFGRHFIPETNLSLSNFRKFFELRKEKLRRELCRILGIITKEN